MDIIKEISSELNESKQWPSFSSGDTITVTYKIKEGSKAEIAIISRNCYPKKRFWINRDLYN